MWISTKDRLPKKHEEVLSMVSGHRRVGYITRLGNEKLFFDGIGYWDLCYFTHWMPLPDPPKKKEK